MRAHRLLAFTLVELLVVIVIVTILAAIVLPVFVTARRKAGQTQCLSNVRQISMGVLQYCGDNDETLPLAVNDYGGGTYVYDYSWVRAVSPYINSLAVFVCPAGAMSPPLNQDDVVPSSDYRDGGLITMTGLPVRGGPLTSYGIPSRARVWLGSPEDDAGSYVGEAAFYDNEYDGKQALMDGISGYATNSNTTGACGGKEYMASSLSLSSIARSSEQIMLLESSRFDVGGCAGRVASPRTRHGSTVKPSVVYKGTKIGYGLCICVFADGHVKAMRAERIYEVVNDKPADYYKYLYPHK